MKMEVDSKSASLKPLQVLQRFSYSTNLPSRNCLRWSKSNRLVGLNVCDKLLIFQLNIHYAINENTINRAQWCEDNLKFSVVTVQPEHQFEFNVGPLENLQKSYREGYMKPNPRMARSEFIYFDFSPSSPFRSYNVLGAITADYVFQLYLQYNSQPWQCICNLTQRLNTHYIENKWKNLKQEKISFSEHCQRLDSLSITCFCFYLDNLFCPDYAEYSLCTATKTGDIVFWKIRISRGEENGKPKCETEIEHIAPSGLQEIVTLQIIGDTWLLIEAACGKAVLFDLAEGVTLSRSVSLWYEADNLPCYNFCFTKLQSGSTEIVFHKVQTVIRVNISADFKLESAQKYSLDEKTELLAIYNYGEKYCATQYSTSSVWLIDFAESNPSSDGLLLQSQIKFNGFAFNRYSSIYDIVSSTNQTIVAFVGNLNTFSSQSSALKNVELIFCAKEDAEFACNFVQNSLASYSNIPNLTDCLYLIRYHLFHRTNFETSLKQLLQFILHKFEDLTSVFYDSSLEPKHLLRFLKTVRFIVRRFEELYLVSPESNFIDDSTLQRVQKLRIHLDQAIRKFTTEEVLFYLLKDDLKDGAVSSLTTLFTGEQMVSLYNINQQSPLNKVFKKVLDQVNKLVQDKGKTAFAGICSSFGIDFTSDNSAHSAQSKCLLNLLNRCPLCDVSSKVTVEALCPQHHQLDICANSLLIADPLQNDLDLCVGCLESKLLNGRIWPSLSTSPFDYSYDRCLFCL